MWKVPRLQPAAPPVAALQPTRGSAAAYHQAVLSPRYCNCQLLPSCYVAINQTCICSTYALPGALFRYVIITQSHTCMSTFQPDEAEGAFFPFKVNYKSTFSLAPRCWFLVPSTDVALTLIIIK